jgi:hypothetical protein
MHQSLSLSDILFPDRLWVLGIKNLPATRWHVCAGAWALMAVLCGIFWTGGLTYWLPGKSHVKTGKNPVGKALVAAARKMDEMPEELAIPEEDLVPAKTDKSKTEDPKPPDPLSFPPSDKTVTKCLIVGYTMKDGELDGLLVSTVQGNEIRYAGIVPASKDPEVRKDLLERFGALKAKSPLFPDLKVQATWLKPRLSCEVESAGVDENQLLKESAFKGLVFPNKPKPAQLPDGTDEGTKDGKDGKDGKNAKDAGSVKDAGTGNRASGGKKTNDTRDAGKKDASRPR